MYVISYAIPRSKTIWVFGSTFGQRFADNPKYFYLYMGQNQRSIIKSVWISKRKEIINFLNRNNMEAYYLYSLKGIWYSLRAKVYIYDNYSKDICFTLSGGAVKINMWHGIPLKKIQMDNKFDPVRYPGNRVNKFKWALRRATDEKPSDYVLTTSELLKGTFESAFRTSNVIVCGYPRNDILLPNSITNFISDEEKKQLCDMNHKGKEKIVLYMPTFRESEKEIFNIIELEQFNNWLLENKILFCIKTHPKSKIEQMLQEIKYGNIYIIAKEADPYPFLNVADILVTDYSSVYFDYLLKDRPIVFFDYDREEYLEKSREFYFDYDEVTPGIKVETMEELKEALLDKKDIWKEKRKSVCEQVFQFEKQTVSEMLYFKILDIIKLIY